MNELKRSELEEAYMFIVDKSYPMTVSLVPGQKHCLLFVSQLEAESAATLKGVKGCTVEVIQNQQNRQMLKRVIDAGNHLAIVHGTVINPITKLTSHDVDEFFGELE